MKKLISLTLLLTCLVSFSQERIGDFKNDLKGSSSLIKEVIPIVNSINSDVAIFIADAKNLYGYKLNKEFKVSEKITSEEKRRKYKTLLGYSIPNEDNYKIILTNKNEKKFLIVDFSFSNKNSIVKEFEFENPKERLVQAISHNNKFYLISVVPFNNYDDDYGRRKTENQIYFGDDFLNFYSIDKQNNLSKKVVDLSKFRFEDKTFHRVKARTLLLPQFEGKIPKMDTRTPTPIDITAKTSKLYAKKNNVVFSFDENIKLTQILEINLNDFTAKKETFKKNLVKTKRSNSFIHNDKILIASANKEELLLEVFDIKSKNVLKSFNIYENEEITFKNSPIIQRGGVYAGYRELKTAKQFLRKITTDKFGISLAKIDDNYELSIGGFTPQKNGGMMMPGFGGIPIGAIGGASLFFNPTMFAYGASAGTKSTQIDCLLDTNFNHIEGELPDSIFDKIDDFLDKQDNGNITEVFKIKDNTILGRYDKSSKMYYFYKF